MFSDQVIISVIAGKGGNGSVSFRRERFVPKGGPDGGDGGKGGDVFIKADLHTKTLIQLYRHPHCKAGDGENGKGQRKNGKNGKDLWLKVPVGTVVEDPINKQILADLTKPGEEYCVAHGGLGGKGNYRFRSSTRQTPNFAQKGESGEERRLQLNLKIIADVGLIGLPNAGKSTLLSRVSAAKPKIADYPFTTMQPHLGVVQVDEENSFVMADIPGLIEGAHKGIGLGIRFLKHIERTKVLVHLLDGSRITFKNLYHDYQIIENELKEYPAHLDQKEKIVVVNKCDLPEVKEKINSLKELFLQKKIEVFFVSAVDGTGVWDLIYQLHHLICIAHKQEESLTREPEEIVRYHYEPDFIIKKEGDVFYIEGEKIIKLAYQYDLANPQALDYFQKKLKNLGVEKALRKKGISNGDRVKIGEKDFYFYS
ncbi:MAG: GTPase ObgE [Elusimicrobiota bacterium]